MVLHIIIRQWAITIVRKSATTRHRHSNSLATHDTWSNRQDLEAQGPMEQVKSKGSNMVGMRLSWHFKITEWTDGHFMVFEVDAAVCRGLQDMRPHDMCACALPYFNPHLSLAYSLALSISRASLLPCLAHTTLTLLNIFATHARILRTA
jgi:hypothetical protein